MTATNRATAESDYFRINWWAWRFVGALDLNARQLHSLRYWRALLSNILITGGFPLTMCLAIFSFDTASENLMNFNIALTALATATKFLIYVSQLKKVSELQNIFVQLDGRIIGAQERTKHNKIVAEMHLLTKMFIWAYGITLINSNLSFAFREKRSLPFPGWLPFDWSESLTNYVIALLYQFVAITMLILQNFVDDLFPPLVLCLIARQCELLYERISCIGYDRSLDLRQNEVQLIDCIWEQKLFYGYTFFFSMLYVCALFLYSNVLSSSAIKLTMDVVSWPMLVQFIVIGIDVGTAMCALFFYVENTQERIYYIFYIFALALEILPVCYYGTLVEDAFGCLHSAVFNSNWVDQSSTYRKIAIIFAERTQRQPKLLAGKFIPITLFTFVGNCKAAYSFCTLIADIRNRN
ncbi:hypothetical protein KR222_007814 [Zaprionus bogoriensis]|nr:hypothetical protein KR222_007814 [Zaprionus bogoriensis]